MKSERYLVAGSGISGIAAAKLLVKAGKKATIYDRKDKLKVEDIKAKADYADIDVVIGELPEEVIVATDIMIISPGIAIDAPFVNSVRDKGVIIWVEIELAYSFC